MLVIGSPHTLEPSLSHAGLCSAIGSDVHDGCHARHTYGLEPMIEPTRSITVGY